MYFQLFLAFPDPRPENTSACPGVAPCGARWSKGVNKKARMGASYLGPIDSTQLQILSVEESGKGPFGDGAPWNVKGRQGPWTA